jgi:hypothetical protein
MSYNRKERDAAILHIGLGKADLKNLPLYQDLQKFGWIVISRPNGYDNNVELTFWGKNRFNRLHKKSVTENQNQ